MRSFYNRIFLATLGVLLILVVSVAFTILGEPTDPLAALRGYALSDKTTINLDPIPAGASRVTSREVVVDHLSVKEIEDKLSPLTLGANTGFWSPVYYSGPAAGLKRNVTRRVRDHLWFHDQEITVNEPKSPMNPHPHPTVEIDHQVSNIEFQKMRVRQWLGLPPS